MRSVTCRHAAQPESFSRRFAARRDAQPRAHARSPPRAAAPSAPCGRSASTIDELRAGNQRRHLLVLRRRAPARPRGRTARASGMRSRAARAVASGRASSASIWPANSSASGARTCRGSRRSAASSASRVRMDHRLHPRARHRAHAFARGRARAARGAAPARPRRRRRRAARGIPVSSSASRSHALRRAAHDLERDASAHRMSGQRERRPAPSPARARPSRRGSRASGVVRECGRRRAGLDVRQHRRPDGGVAQEPGQQQQVSSRSQPPSRRRVHFARRASRRAGRRRAARCPRRSSARSAADSASDLVDVALRVVVVMPGLRIDAAHRADHLRGEQDVVDRDHLQQQLDARAGGRRRCRRTRCSAGAPSSGGRFMSCARPR